MTLKKVETKATVENNTDSRKYRQDNTKRILLETATNLFSQKGYEGVSLRTICAEADVSLPMVSYYFGNKAGLYKAVLEHLTNIFNEELNKVDMSKMPPEQKLRCYLDVAVRVHLENPAFAGVFGHEAWPSDVLMQVMKSKDNRYFGDYIASLLEEEQKLGHLKDDIEPLYAARIMAALFNSHPTISNLYESFYKTAPEREKILHAVKEFCLRAVELETP